MSSVVNEWIIRNDKVSREQAIRLQLLIYYYLASIELTRDEMKALTHIGLLGTTPLNVLCASLVKSEIYTSTTSARNVIGRLEAKKLIQKKGDNRKTVSLTDSMMIRTTENILLDLKILYREPVKQ